MEILRSGEKLVGAKQTAKAIKDGRARLVFLAEDAEERVIEPIVTICSETGTEYVFVSSMEALGKACGISVKAAAAAILI